ncbi:hypothetical protein GCM10009555_039240 [Acrocarpospora macrocephala]|uniref:Uncharacterized protein n=1 Tax=Acrocarpospora macrocephala TaxID=150177 RepID=A0A5M3WMT8_9ACTN|nr:DUF6461 domain-containing protein [Acrocarpospora macrocephala]GES09810.1 hypothetical protein Amac_034060 [Acrocarpospora macrocephala]
MSSAIAEDYAWFDQHDSGLAEAFCVTFVRGLTPRQAFDRLGVTPDDDPDDDGFYEEGVMAASAVDGGTVLIEFNGFQGILDSVTGPLSVGTVTAAVFRNVNHDQQFVHAADGRVTATFEPDYPAHGGVDEDLLLTHMVELGMPTDDVDDADDWGNPIHTAFALAERVTGVRLTPGAIDSPALIGSIAHLS